MNEMPRMAERRDRGQKRQHARRDRQPVGTQGRIRNQRNGAHRGEMVRNDRDRQQGRRDQRMTAVVLMRGDNKRQACEYAPEQHRGKHDTRRPDDARRQLQRHHPGVVHGGDTHADHRTADRNRRATVIEQRNAEADRSDGHCEDQRHQGDRNVVAGARTAIVGQHRDKVGGPNSATADGRIEAHPDHAGEAVRGLGAMKQADRHRAGEPADRASENDQPQIMLGDEAIQNLIHYRPPLWVCNDDANGAHVVTGANSSAPMVNKCFELSLSGCGFPQLPGNSRHQFAAGFDLER